MYDYSKKNYDCPGQGFIPKMPKQPQQARNGFAPMTAPESLDSRGPEQKRMEDSYAQVITPNTTSLSVIPQTALDRFDVIAQTLADIRTYQNLVVDVRDKESFNVATKAKSVVRNLRLKIQNRETEEKAKITKMGKTLKADALLLISEIRETEDKLSVELKKWTDEQERIAAEAAERIRLRQIVVNNNFTELTQTCNKGMHPGADSKTIETALIVLRATTIPQGSYDERYQEACNLLNFSIEKTQTALDGALVHEERRREAVRLELESQRVAQVSWFNENFGVMASLDTMETALNNLIAIGPAHHMGELIAKQIEQGQTIVDLTRARMPAPTPEPEPEPKPEDVCPTAKEQTTEVSQTSAREGNVVQIMGRGNRQPAPPAREETQGPDKTMLVENFQKINAIIQHCEPGNLELILSNGNVSAPIMLPPESLHAILAMIKTNCINAINAKA